MILTEELHVFALNRIEGAGAVFFYPVVLVDERHAAARSHDGAQCFENVAQIYGASGLLGSLFTRQQLQFFGFHRIRRDQ